MTPDLLDQLSIEKPLLQAAMGGGVANPELVCAVSKAGGLGCLGFSSLPVFKKELNAVKQVLSNHPFAVNLLMPFVTKAHIRYCIEQRVPVVSIFYGFKKGLVETLKQAGCTVLYQVGTLYDAERAIHEGADGLIIQGHEAGGHLSGTSSLENILPQIRDRFPNTLIIGAGGVYNRESATKVRSYGANGVAMGTRFLMSIESGAHELYKQKLLPATHTQVTTLFGMGWHAPHRVIDNAATHKWTNKGVLRMRWPIALNIAMSKTAKYMPISLQDAIYYRQGIALPFYTPALPGKQHQNPPVEHSALYAGECVAHIHELKSAADIINDTMGDLS